MCLTAGTSCYKLHGMNGLHLCSVCTQAFELDELNWDVETRTGACDPCMREYYALWARYGPAVYVGRRLKLALWQRILHRRKNTYTQEHLHTVPCPTLPANPAHS